MVSTASPGPDWFGWGTVLLDAALVGRIGRSVELRGGFGVHAVSADATLRYSLDSDPAGTVRELTITKQTGATSLFAAAQYATRAPAFDRQVPRCYVTATCRSG